MTDKPKLDQSNPTVRLAEERAIVSKRSVDTSKVRIRTCVESYEELADAILQSETADVRRIQMDQDLDSLPQIRQDGNVTIIPIVEEVLVVQKRLVLKEELHIERRVTSEAAEIPVTLRRQKGIVEHLDAAGNIIRQEEPNDERQ